MKKYRMPYETFEDEHTKVLRKTKPPEFLDPEYYVRAHFKKDSEGNGPFMLNSACRKMLDSQGPFKTPYLLAENELIDIHKGKECFIVCPGPSLSTFAIPKPPKKSTFNAVTMAINSAGFAGINEMYWVICESGYMRWLLKGRRWQWQDRVFITTARCAVFMRRVKVNVRKVFVSRWEEEFVVPPRTPAVSISNALCSAWEMGCTAAYLVGFDQSKPNGVPYMEGLPHTPKGAQNPYDDQLRAMKQFQLPDFKIYNGSKYSSKLLPFEYMSYEEISKRWRDSYVERVQTRPSEKLPGFSGDI